MATVTDSKESRKQRSDVTLGYLRPGKKFPNVWCPGCGIGVVMGAFIRALDKLGYGKDEVVMVSGIGCSSRMPVYMDFNSLHTTHGRALPFATGVKFARPEMKVVVITGDGDALAIGGNHFIHACRRNIDITTIVMNNNIYGMTGGQGSPTTPANAFSTTTPYGNSEKHFDACELAKAAGATWVGRGTVYHTPQLENLITKALEHKGFSLVEAVSNCHTYFGRLNRQGDAVTMLQSFKENAVMASKAKSMTKEELEGKFTIGVLHDDTQTSEFCDEYRMLVERVRAKKK
ncbi:MAG TPA: 2-oxoacid:ferredoxin oxidoreductase subunit beta [candidate division Zixibacteria bacterium]|nr:2-oxoacid:ferredoxin oxidoreductase subunit beta [candidate division Zixibacteria bacterium]